jgi:hypothetical protein
MFEEMGNRRRRSGLDRRYFSYSDHIPERRSGNDRRSMLDRRTGSDRRLERTYIINMLDDKRIGSDRRSA